LYLECPPVDHLQEKSMSVTVIVRLTAKSGRLDELLSNMEPAVAATRAQLACESVDLLRGVENTREILLLECWPTVEAHEDFINGVIEAGGLDDIMPLLDGPIDTRHYT